MCTMRLCVEQRGQLWLMLEKNSALVRGSLRNVPSAVLVTVREPTF